MQRLPKQVAAVTAALALAAAAASCGSSSSSSSSASSSGGGAVPSVDVTKFTADYAVMKTLQGLAAQGKGKIGVLLPDTTTSTRYVQYDAPNLTKAFEAAGLSSSDFKIDNAQGSAATMQQQAEADITDGASVLLIDPIDSGSGAAIEKNAESKGVKVIDYDRLVLGGPSDRYYVSFNNVKVGQLIGQGEVDCITAWDVKNPQHPDHGRRSHRQQREAVRAGLQRRAGIRSSPTAPTRRSASRPARGIRRRPRPCSSSSTRRTRTSTRWSRPTTTTPGP